MQTSDKTARQLYAEIKANPTRKRFGFGRVPALINVDLQKAYTRVDEFKTAYETNPKQIDYVNQLAELYAKVDVANTLDRLKALGFHWATRSGVTCTTSTCGPA